MSLFFELHRDLPREGPGDDATTARVLGSIVAELPPEPDILDIGCGPGAQTLVLARETRGRITGVDLHGPFLNELERRAQAAGLRDRIRIERASMDALPFAPASFDLLWSEGAIWVMGFARGLEAWRPLLRPRGIVAVSELTWLTETPEPEERAFWSEAYPAMQDRAVNRAALASTGYELLGEFDVPRESWFADYLDPLERRADVLSAQYAGDPAALREIDAQRREIDIARRYRGFGYVFYVARVSPGDHSGASAP